MCTVLLPPGVNPIVVNKYIISYIYIWPGVAQWLRSAVTGIFLVDTDRTMCPGVNSASKKISTRDSPGGKGGRCVRLTTQHPCSAERQEIWGLNLSGPPWAISTAYCGRDLYLNLSYLFANTKRRKKLEFWWIFWGKFVCSQMRRASWWVAGLSLTSWIYLLTWRCLSIISLRPASLNITLNYGSVNVFMLSLTRTFSAPHFTGI